MAVDVVIFDNSGSMSGSPIGTAFDHALDTFGPGTEWRTCDGQRLEGGRLGDPDALRRIRGFMGPSTFGKAIAASCAPGVRMTIYTDEYTMPGQDDPFSVLDGIGGDVHFVGPDAEWVHDARRALVDAHPDLRVRMLTLASA